MAGKFKTVKIQAHPGNTDHENSGVLTSKGIKFHGETVSLDSDEAEMLIVMNRAKEVEPEPKSKK